MELPPPSTTAAGPARRLAWLLVGVLIGLALLLWLPRAPGPAAGDARDGAPGRAAGGWTDDARDADADAVDPAAAPGAPRGAPPMNAANRAIELGEDLHALALAALPLAEDGDAEAQYSLAQVIEVCAFELTRFADAEQLARRRAELMDRAGGVHGPAAAALDEERFRMCDGFRRDPLERFGDREEWLVRAVASGHPLASVEMALELYRSTPASEGELTPAARRARQRELFLVGLRSGRPEALWEGFFFAADDAGSASSGTLPPRAMGWLLLACARGLECSRAARWRREQEALGGTPAFDDPADALLFDLAPADRELARERARELAEALDRGDAAAVLPDLLREAPP